MTEQETLELHGYRKAYALLQKGMESQAELMDGLKQSERTARALATRLAEALTPFVPHPDIDCGNDDVYGRAQSALADARAAGLTKETK